ncbi:hypothetical protein HHI36_020874 [Cryptolaemus montrouzieri]|uniref:Reverse transcriptase domain-containing protein n=1 Tax=Cryptolaemus montrouzieri TaxID=559131 RepID=A0ABD2NCM8_9CUCU
MPVPKSVHPATFNDLSPISVLPSLEKVLPAQIPSILTNLMYLPGISLKVIDDLIRSQDDSILTVMVLLDFSIAFDTVNHKLLLAVCTLWDLIVRL